MAKVKYSGIITEVSGKLGDEVHSHNHKSNYIRKATKKKYIKTDARIKANETFSKGNREWGGLTEYQMDRWDEMARKLRVKSLSTGKEIISGYILYKYSSINLLEIGEEPLTDAPGMFKPDYYHDIRFEYVKEGEKRDIRMYFGTPIDPDIKIVLYATRSLSRGQRYVDPAWYKKIGVVGGEFMSGDSIKKEYHTKYEEVDEEKYKINFAFREVHRKSGISNFPRPCRMLLSKAKPN